MKKLRLVLLLLFTIASIAQNANKRSASFNLENQTAIQGYDPVSYFVQKKPTPGKKEFAVFHDGVRYLFLSKENKEIFSKNPSAYEPQYGGWCAYAMGSSGDKVEINPETYKILDGKLYLFYNAYFNNTLKSWNKTEKELKAKADANWKKIYK